MSSGRLHLKRTPAERAEREARKIQKEARRLAKRGAERDDAYTSLSEGDPGPHTDKSRRGWKSRSVASSADRQSHLHSQSSGPKTEKKRKMDRHADRYTLTDDEDTPDTPADPALKEAAYRKLEEARFREKMQDALEDDFMDGSGFAYGGSGATYRADRLEADYRDQVDRDTYVPRRWGGNSGTGRVYGSDDEGITERDPNLMTDDEYAAWLRRGMYEKQHASEIAEQKRREQDRAARKHRSRLLKEETSRLTREADLERAGRKAAREKKRAEAEARRLVEARLVYEERWKMLLAASAASTQLRFDDIPWPIFFSSSTSSSSPMSLPPRILPADLTQGAIAWFLLPDEVEKDDKARRDKLRETMLRFHPDKFEGKIARRVSDVRDGGRERERAIEAAGVVVRVLNDLLKVGAS